MASDNYGYRYGARKLVEFGVDSATSDITEGDMLTMGTAGYVQQAAAGSNVLVGFAAEGVSSPSSDGDVSILVDVSPDAVYAFPPDAGSVTVGLKELTCDIGGARSVDIDASTDDVILIRDVDTSANLAFISIVAAKQSGVS